MGYLEHAVAVYAFISAGIGALLWLHFSALKKIEALRRKIAAQDAEQLARIGRLCAEVSALAERQAELPPAPPAVSGMNLNRRSQALRMARRGDPPDRIAGALGIPRSEVELLLKVQRTLMGAA